MRVVPGFDKTAEQSAKLITISQQQMTFKAFLSSTYKDLKKHRQYVIDALRKAGFSVDPMEDWPAGPEEPKVFSQERIEGCHLCVLLVALRRGHVPEGEHLSITQMEYRAAVELGIDVLVFMLDEDAPWPRKHDELDKDEMMRGWRESLLEQHGVSFFETKPGTIDIAPALTRWINENGTKVKSTTSGPDSIVSFREEKEIELPIFEVPFPQKVTFTGRQHELDAIHEHFTPKETTSAVPYVITGLGGMGKTQLAVQYAHRHRHEYDLVWWFRSEDSTLLGDDLRDLSLRLNLDIKTVAEQQIYINFVRGWFQKTDIKWLLIFDNAENPDELEPILPSGQTGHILITSRTPHWGHLAKRVSLKPFSKDVSQAFLLERTKQSDVGAAKETADLLGGLPLLWSRLSPISSAEIRR